MDYNETKLFQLMSFTLGAIGQAGTNKNLSEAAKVMNDLFDGYIIALRELLDKSS